MKMLEVGDKPRFYRDTKKTLQHRSRMRGGGTILFAPTSHSTRTPHSRWDEIGVTSFVLLLFRSSWIAIFHK